MRYQEELKSTLSMLLPAQKALICVGDLAAVIGGIIRQINLSKPEIIEDVDFAVMKDEYPSLLSRKDMITNGFVSSLQGS